MRDERQKTETFNSIRSDISAFKVFFTTGGLGRKDFFSELVKEFS